MARIITKNENCIISAQGEKVFYMSCNENPIMVGGVAPILGGMGGYWAYLLVDGVRIYIGAPSGKRDFFRTQAAAAQAVAEACMALEAVANAASVALTMVIAPATENNSNDNSNAIASFIDAVNASADWSIADEAQAADIAADYEDSEVAERIAAEEVAPALPLHVNVEINKRMHSAPATLFDMQPLQNLARCMPINAEITAKNGDVYFLWGASEFPAYMAEDGSAEIWAFPNSRPCRWLSISLGDAPRPAFVPERDDEEAAAEFWREDAIPF